MIEDGAWAVPSIKDREGNYVKDNHAPELLIKYIAHDLKCNIIVFDLALNRIQFLSGNDLKDGNVVFDSPLLLYCTGGHFQSVFQIDHEYFVNYVKKLEFQNMPAQMKDPSSNQRSYSVPQHQKHGEKEPEYQKRERSSECGQETDNLSI